MKQLSNDVGHSAAFEFDTYLHLQLEERIKHVH